MRPHQVPGRDPERDDTGPVGWQAAGCGLFIVLMFVVGTVLAVWKFIELVSALFRGLHA